MLFGTGSSSAILVSVFRSNCSLFYVVEHFCVTCSIGLLALFARFVSLCRPPGGITCSTTMLALLARFISLCGASRCATLPVFGQPQFSLFSCFFGTCLSLAIPVPLSSIL